MKGFQWGTNVGPHGATTRWTYTVPANRLALVTVVNINLMRIVAATTLGQATALIEATINGTATTLARVVNYLTAVQTTSLIGAYGQNSLLAASDKLAAVTSDGSVGGQNNYMISAEVIEFDAIKWQLKPEHQDLRLHVR